MPIRHTTYEPELTVGSGIRCVTGAEFDGGSDLGYNRMNFRWGNVGTFQISPGSHMWQVVNKYYKSNEPVPITMCFGVPPACTLLAGAGFDYAVLPMGCDEIGIAGAVQGAPDPAGEGAHRQRHGARRLPSWCSKATSIRATAASRPRNRRTPASRAASTSIRNGRATWARPTRRRPSTSPRITMREPKTKPIIFALGVHTLDDHNIDTTVREAAIYELCNRLQPGIVQNVVIPYCMTDWGGCIIQVKKRHQIDEGWQRNFLAAALSCSQGMRLAIAVSEDVDPYSMDDVMWCLTTRVNPQHRHPQPDPGRPRPDLHAGRAHDRGREAVDRLEHAVSRAAWASMPRCRSATRATSCARSIRSTGSSPRTSSRKKDIENAQVAHGRAGCTRSRAPGGERFTLSSRVR